MIIMVGDKNPDAEEELTNFDTDGKLMLDLRYGVGPRGRRESEPMRPIPSMGGVQSITTMHRGQTIKNSSCEMQFRTTVH